jgi:hypothetical protein
MPPFDYLADKLLQIDGDAPIRIVRSHLPEITVVADVVPDPVFVDIGMYLGFPSYGFHKFEGFEDRAGVPLATTKVVDFRDPRGIQKTMYELRDVQGMDIVPDLFAFIPEDLVFPAFQVAFDEVTQEAMEFHAGMVRPGQASAAQTTGGDTEIPPVFLDHDIRGHFGGTEQGVFALIDGKGLCDAMLEIRRGIVPTGVLFDEFQGIRAVAVHLVGGHMDKGAFGAVLANCFQEVERTDGIGVKIVKRNGGRPVVGRLGRSMDYGVGADFLEQVRNPFSVPDVQFMVLETMHCLLEAGLVPSGIALLPEEYGALVVVHSVDVVTLSGKVGANF